MDFCWSLHLVFDAVAIFDSSKSRGCISKVLRKEEFVVFDAVAIFDGS